MKVRHWLTIAGFVFWLLESSWFGWNLRARSDAERLCDDIAVALMLALPVLAALDLAGRLGRFLDDRGYR